MNTNEVPTKNPVYCFSPLVTAEKRGHNSRLLWLERCKYTSLYTECPSKFRMKENIKWELS